MKTIMAAISLAVATGFGALRIWKVAKGDGSTKDKIAAVHNELAKIIDKLENYATHTEPVWDDNLAIVLSDVLDAIAENVIDELEG